MATGKVFVFDTTLRDGEQAAGTRLGSRDKLTLAKQLARLNVDIIEAGYPASSPDDFEAVQRIAVICRSANSGIASPDNADRSVAAKATIAVRCSSERS